MSRINGPVLVGENDDECYGPSIVGADGRVLLAVGFQNAGAEEIAEEVAALINARLNMGDTDLVGEIADQLALHFQGYHIAEIDLMDRQEGNPDTSQGHYDLARSIIAKVRGTVTPVQPDAGGVEAETQEPITLERDDGTYTLYTIQPCGVVSSYDGEPATNEDLRAARYVRVPSAEALANVIVAARTDCLASMVEDIDGYLAAKILRALGVTD